MLDGVVEERQTILDQKLTTLAGAVLTARTERITKEALYRQMRALPPAQLGTFPLVMDSGALMGPFHLDLRELT